MSNTVKLNSRNKTALRDRALVAILQGEVVVVAAEHGYLYICDAFNKIAVSQIHERGEVLSETYSEDGTRIHAMVDAHIAQRIEEMIDVGAFKK